MGQLLTPPLPLPVPVASGGTGAATAAAGLANLGGAALASFTPTSWTPVLSADGTAPTGVTYQSGQQVGLYVQIGKLVQFHFRIWMTSKGSGGVGNTIVTGLPIAASEGVIFPPGYLIAQSVTHQTNYTAFGLLVSGSFFYVSEDGSNQSIAFVPWSNMAAGSIITGGGFYFTA